MSRTLLKNALLVTGARTGEGSILIEDGKISSIAFYDSGETIPDIPSVPSEDLGGLAVMPGAVDIHVHFREPGLTHKGDIASGSRAALMGGVTSFVDMPNTIPPTTDGAALEEKYRIASAKSLANYGFHIGATSSNIMEIKRLCSQSPESFGGIKVFLGSSTGNMLLNDCSALDALFSIKGKCILIHSEDENIIKDNLAKAVSAYGDAVPFTLHPLIRSREACIKSTADALERAMRLGTRLHVLHVSTAEEVELIRTAKGYNQGITAETTAGYLLFSDEDYPALGPFLKCNPAIKSPRDREALRDALRDGTIDTIGSDHAPHLKEEKLRPYTSCPSGVPSVGDSLHALLAIAEQDGIPLGRIAEVMSETPARILGIKGKGQLKEGFDADFVVLDPDAVSVPEASDSPCGWTPYEGMPLKGRIHSVWLAGEKSVSNGNIISRPRASRLSFIRSDQFQ